MSFFFFFQAEDGIRDLTVTGVQTCALPILGASGGTASFRIAFSSRVAISAKANTSSRGTVPPIRTFPRACKPSEVLPVRTQKFANFQLISGEFGESSIAWAKARIASLRFPAQSYAIPRSDQKCAF